MNSRKTYCQAFWRHLRKNKRVHSQSTSRLLAQLRSVKHSLKSTSDAWSPTHKSTLSWQKHNEGRLWAQNQTFQTTALWLTWLSTPKISLNPKEFLQTATGSRRLGSQTSGMSIISVAMAIFSGWMLKRTRSTCSSLMTALLPSRFQSISSMLQPSLWEPIRLKL